MTEVVGWNDIQKQLLNLIEEVENNSTDLSKDEILKMLEERLEPHVFEAIDVERAEPPRMEGL